MRRVSANYAQRPDDSAVSTLASVYTPFNGGDIKQIDNWHSGLASGTTAPTSLGTSISSYSWTYDSLDRAASFTAPEGTFAYGYDATSQLTSATFTVASGWTGGTPASESFNFDATGNRTGTGYSVDKNRLLSDGTYNYTYDGNGNRTSRTEIATGKYLIYSWDHRNRLTKVEYRDSSTGPATKIVANTYDAFDRRVMKQVDDNADGTFDRTERYVWDGDQISLVLDANGAVLHRFLHGPAIDQVFADEDSVNGLLWDLGDHQNTTRDVIDNTGAVVNHLTYSPFGVIASESDVTKTPFAAYTGGDWDEDLGLLLLGYRWLESSTGRWLSEDPIRFGAGDPNLLRYVGNSPTNFTDPSGLQSKQEQFAHVVDNIVKLTERIRVAEETGKYQGEEVGEHTLESWNYDLELWEQRAAQLAAELERQNPSKSFEDPLGEGIINDLCKDKRKLQKEFVHGLQDATRAFGEYAKEYAKQRAQDALTGVVSAKALELAFELYRLRGVIRRHVRDLLADEVGSVGLPGSVGKNRCASKDAFEIAQQGGKHAGFLKNYVGKPPAQIQNGINSLKKQIAEHRDKIANPHKYIPGFNNLDPRQQQALLNQKWPSDIARQQEQLEILEGLLKTAGGGS